MKHKRTLYLIIALVLAAVAAYFIYKHVRHLIETAIRGVVTEKVVGEVADVVTGKVVGGVVEEVGTIPGKVLPFGK